MGAGGARTGANGLEAVALEEGDVGVQIVELLGTGGSDEEELFVKCNRPHVQYAIQATSLLPFLNDRVMPKHLLLLLRTKLTPKCLVQILC